MQEIDAGPKIIAMKRNLHVVCACTVDRPAAISLDLLLHFFFLQFANTPATHLFARSSQPCMRALIRAMHATGSLSAQLHTAVDGDTALSEAQRTLEHEIINHSTAATSLVEDSTVHSAAHVAAAVLGLLSALRTQQ
jgi:hydroxyacyl-ACP dehydratase HTD2-like protein with hotdog domain